MDNTLIREITKLVMDSIKEQEGYARIPVGISTRHVHLCPTSCAALFGEQYNLTPMKSLQAGEFAAKETITIVGSNMRAIEKVRVLGPLRKNTQVEIARTDAIYLKINAPWRNSGDLKDSAPITLVGPKGSISLKEGAIIAKRHIHVPTHMATQLALIDQQEVAVEAFSERTVILKGVQIRVADDVELQIHLDTDDANAAGLNNNSKVRILTGGGNFG